MPVASTTMSLSVNTCSLLLGIYLFFAVCNNVAFCQAFINYDTQPTNQEQVALDKFREVVQSKLPHEYMKKDAYLLQWLKARNFDIRSAVRMLYRNLKWRKENQLDHILEEDWDNFEKEYQYEVQGCDKGGRPVISIQVGDWDVRKAVLSGNSPKMMRYFDKVYEEVATYIRHSQDKGENITHYDFLFDMAGYNVFKQGCPLCVAVYLYFFRTFESHFPGATHRNYMVNVPPIFIPVWTILNPILSEQTRATISLHGRNSNAWKRVLLKDIDPTHLTKEYGGIKEEAYSAEELKDDGGHFQCSKYAGNKKPKNKATQNISKAF